MAVRVSFVEARRSSRLQSYLDGVLTSLLPRKGFQGNLACDVRVRKEKGTQHKGANQFTCTIHVHGNKRFESLVVGKGDRVTEAVRHALRKFESRLGREHERIVRTPRRKVILEPLPADAFPAT